MRRYWTANHPRKRPLANNALRAHTLEGLGGIGSAVEPSLPVSGGSRKGTRGPKELSQGEETFALHCKADGFTPEREYLFHPTRKWRFDFAWPEQKLALEVEGIGRHQRIGGFKADAEKYNAAAILGWRVLRFTTDMVKRGDAINAVHEALGVPYD